MTTYAIDVDRRHLVAIWPTGRGAVARMIAALETVSDVDGLFELAQSLTRLSSEFWRSYVAPAKMDDEGAADGDGGGDLDQVLSAITKPNLPQDGYLIVSYIALLELAHRVGRALHVLGDTGLERRVADEVAEEFDAVRRAEQGDLSGRARQAAVLSRLDASPTQIDYADRLLRDDPLCSAEQFWEFEPAAACVAAAHWLAAGAEVAAAVAGTNAAAVFAEADNIEAVSVEVPAAAVAAIEEGHSPYGAVMRLLSEAAAAADGRIHRIDVLLDGIQDARALAQRCGGGARLLRELLPTRTTPLDPARPATDLLEHLLDGLRSAWLLFRESADFGERGGPLVDGVSFSHPPGGTWEDHDPDDDEDPGYDEAFRQATKAAFFERCRDVAARDSSRLHAGRVLGTLGPTDEELQELIEDLFVPALDPEEEDDWESDEDDDESQLTRGSSAPIDEQQLQYLIERDDVAGELGAMYPVGVRWGAQLSGVFPMLILGRPDGLAAPALDALGDHDRRVWPVGHVTFSLLERVEDNDESSRYTVEVPGDSIAVVAELRVCISAGVDWPPDDGEWETIKIAFLGHRDAKLLTEFVKSGVFEATIPEARDGDSYDVVTGHVDSLELAEMLRQFGLFDPDVFRGG